jgi:hypothetical protein
VTWLEFWEFTSADWAGLQFLALVVAAGFAFYEAREARKLRRAQAEPFVVADFEVDDDQRVFIVISNIGATVAENVRCTFDPEPRSSLEANLDLVPLRETKAFTTGIASLPPGKRFRAFFDLFTSRDRHELPDEYKVSMTFDAPALKETGLKTSAVLDLGVYWNLLVVDVRPRSA